MLDTALPVTFGDIPMDPDAPPIDISAMRAGDRRRATAFAVRFRRRDHAVVARPFDTVGGSITAILRRAGAQPIRRLAISMPGEIDGRRMSLHWGTQVVRRDNLRLHAEQLGRLREHLAPDAMVTLLARDAGQDRPLLKGLAQILGVPVQAPLTQLPATRWIARFVRCYPGGRRYEIHLDFD